jgi:hypoxanthine phosphoribosyltransferase
MRVVERDYRPTLIVGVRTGGLAVAESMARHASAAAPVLPVTSRRASTDAKSRIPLLRVALGALPRPTANLLRRVEHRLLIASRSHHQRQQLIDHGEVAAIADWLTQSTLPSRVLVADDAVDSGVTLTTVVRHIAAACPPHTDIRTAVITQTLEEPVMQPDYCLFQNTLCRFPWSFDARP